MLPRKGGSVVKRTDRRTRSSGGGQRITPADEEYSRELIRADRRPIEGWWSNRWVVDLEPDSGEPHPGGNVPPKREPPAANPER